MSFWLNYSDKKNHLKRSPFGVKNIGYLLIVASEFLESDKLNLLLISEAT